ncbi:MAG TPA: hypothetical protein ENI55_00870 [Alphaproteobacteria bacterium]|nr:hypothetical protein [Alphaproteobacteria bacterium]
MKILQLECGLFPDQETVLSAVRVLEGDGHAVSRTGVGGLAADDDAAWDAVVHEVMTVDKVITV